MKLNRLTALILSFAMLTGISAPKNTVSEPYMRGFAAKAAETADTTSYLGDPTFDNKVDSNDATLILSEYSSLSTGGKPTFTDEQRIAADVNTDGNIDAKDATIVVSYYSYLSTGGKSSISDFISESRISSLATKNSQYDKFFDISNIPEYKNSPYTAVNNNVPYFSPYDFSGESFEYYSPLDELGRCGICMACIGKDLMPTEERGEIGSITPSGWHLARYDDIIKDKYLYNRCHLIGYQLTAENANEKNLVTGTRYLNVDGMLPFENRTANYIKSTKNHVLYRVTPVFSEAELVCRGVLIEAYSLEDNGKGLCFNVFCYNVQPGIEIDYSTGDSKALPQALTTTSVATTKQTTTATRETTAITITTSTATTTSAPSNGSLYVANTSSHVFHYASCASVKKMSDANKWSTDSRDELIGKGYKPCSKCNP